MARLNQGGGVFAAPQTLATFSSGPPVYLAGAKDVVFPEGTFKPPIICPVWSG